MADTTALHTNITKQHCSFLSTRNFNTCYFCRLCIYFPDEVSPLESSIMSFLGDNTRGHLVHYYDGGVPPIPLCYGCTNLSKEEGSERLLVYYGKLSAQIFRHMTPIDIRTYRRDWLRISIDYNSYYSNEYSDTEEKYRYASRHYDEEQISREIEGDRQHDVLGAYYIEHYNYVTSLRWAWIVACKQPDIQAQSVVVSHEEGIGSTRKYQWRDKIWDDDYFGESDCEHYDAWTDEELEVISENE